MIDQIQLEKLEHFDNILLLFSFMFFGAILHFVGDYLLQNDWMAQNKTKSWVPAFAHATVYSIPFCLIVRGWWFWLIPITHYLIDRYRLATYWIRLVNWNWDLSVNNCGYKADKPVWMAVWLMIIIDNVWHILINTFAIYMNFTL